MRQRTADNNERQNNEPPTASWLYAGIKLNLMCGFPNKHLSCRQIFYENPHSANLQNVSANA
jgi:hypothetical protein